MVFSKSDNIPVQSSRGYCGIEVRKLFNPKKQHFIFVLSSTSFLMTLYFIIIIMYALFRCMSQCPVKRTAFPSMQPKQFRVVFEQLHAGKCSPRPFIPFSLSPTRKMPAVHHKLLLEEALQDSPQVNICILDLCSMFQHS